MIKDIQSREDIELLVDTFYGYVQSNAILEPIFNDVALVDWKEHLPKLYRFWASALIDEQSFRGNPMQVHLQLSLQTRMSKVEFDEWLTLFNSTVDELFVGETANEAKFRAARIAYNFQRNINAFLGDKSL